MTLKMSARNCSATASWMGNCRRKVKSSSLQPKLLSALRGRSP